MKDIDCGSTAVAGWFGPFRHPIDDAPVLALASSGELKRAMAHRVRLRRSGAENASRCLGISNETSQPECGDDLNEERKDQRETESDVAHTQLTARQPCE